MRSMFALMMLCPSLAIAGPFSGHVALGEMGIDNSDPSGLSDVTFVQQIADGGLVGPGIEAELIPPYVSGDFSDVDRTITIAVNTSWAALPFNGLRFTLTDPGAPTLGTPYLVSTNIVGFNINQVTTDGSRVAVNFSGRSSVGTVTIGFTPGPELDITGSCPGPARMAFTNFTPNGPIALVAGAAGSSVIPGGPCAGTALPVRRARLIGTYTANGAGDYRLPISLPAGACGASVVAVDLSTCEVTDLEVVP